MVDFVVPCEMSAFPACIRDVSELHFTDADLAHALFVTGRAPGEEARFGFASVWEYRHRAALVPAYVRAGSASHLARSDLVLDLDRSEKGNLSYSLGQAMTAIFCDRALGVGRLLHVDRYAPRHKVEFGPSGQRPDLFGESSEGWIVAESKGRSSGISADLREKAINQKRMVRTIGGVAPWIAVGCVSAFSRSNGTMKLHAFDPDEVATDASDVSIDRDRFALAYYSPFLRAFDLADQRSVADRLEYATPDRSSAVLAGVTIGLDPTIEQLVRAAEAGSLTGLADGVDEILGDTETQPTGGNFRDGSLFATSWDVSLRLRDFDERGVEAGQ